MKIADEVSVHRDAPAPALAGQSVLVTGASGFIGGHLVRRLTALGCRVSCPVRATSHIDDLRLAGVRLTVCDIADHTGVAHAIASSSARFVFHLAGLVRAADPGEFMRVNAGGAEAVAQACAEQADPPVLVLVSSLAAAGPSRDRPIDESDPPLPVSHYGRSKLAGEQLALKYATAVPVTVVRPGIVFGAGDRGMVGLFRLIARSGLHVFSGSEDCHVSLVAVADLVDCLVLAAEHGERVVAGNPGHGIYFAASEDVSYVDLGRKIARALGRPLARSQRLPEWSMRTIGWLGDVVTRVAQRPAWIGSDKVHEILAGSWTCSSAKARWQLGWKPADALAERLRETAQWYSEARWI
jgi:dihydroflavonol-4-reductase